VVEMFDVNELILKKAKELGFGDVVVLGYERDRRQVRFANNEITVAKNWHERKVELFVELEKRVAGTTITELSEENIERTLKTLLSNMRGMAPKEDYYGIAEGPFEYRDIPETFERIVLKALAKQPEDRFASAEEIAHFLSAGMTSGKNPGGSG